MAESTINAQGYFLPIEGKALKLIECSRDAMQGWKTVIPTQKKIEYIDQLLKVGFDTIDFGSFVSPKAIPGMADTKEVIKELDTAGSPTKLLAIIANERGANEAMEFEKISYLGFPFSVSPTFQKRNTNSTIEESLERVTKINSLCNLSSRELVVYISMAFGNPYGDPYDEKLVLEWIRKLSGVGVKTISLADTVGLAQPAQVSAIVERVIAAFPGIETGVHLHSTHDHWKQKVDAALQNGCMRFDGALKGIGGCPMAGDKLVGNMDTQLMSTHFKQLGYPDNLNEAALAKASEMSSKIFK